jgi:transposase
MGRSRGGLTTKIHALVDAHGLPIALKLTEGQAHDGSSARDMLEALVEGQTLLADRAYDSDALRQTLAERGAWANIKPMRNRLNVPAFSPFLYRYRNLVEPFFNKIKPLPRRRNPLRQAPRQLPRRRQTRFTQNLDAI